MWYFFFYLVSIANNIAFLFGALAIISGILLIFSICFYPMITDEDMMDEPIDAKKLITRLILSVLFFGLLHSLIPDKKDMLLIAAGGAIGTFVSSNKDAQALPADVVRWMHTELKAATDEISPVVQKKKEELEGLDKEVLVKKLLAAGDSLK